LAARLAETAHGMVSWGRGSTTAPLHNRNRSEEGLKIPRQAAFLPHAPGGISDVVKNQD
jgi:hypothetical protein